MDKQIIERWPGQDKMSSYCNRNLYNELKEDTGTHGSRVGNLALVNGHGKWQAIEWFVALLLAGQ